MKATNKFPPVAGELILILHLIKYEEQVLIFRQKRLPKRGHLFCLITTLRDCFKNKEFLFYKLISVKTLIPG